MGLHPQIWGPSAWHFIHAVAMTYPKDASEAKKRAYQEFFSALPIILPCEICGSHLFEKIEKNPPPYTNSKEMFQWTVDLHNSVNKENGKPELTFDEALAEFRKNSPKITDDSAQDQPTKKYISSNEIKAIVFVSGLAVSFIAGMLIAKIYKTK